MTVKGLEPEIQRLIAKHKSEIKKVKSIHEAELLASDERAGQRYIKMTEELRDQLAKEKEAACNRERELARQTWVCLLPFETVIFFMGKNELKSILMVGYNLSRAEGTTDWGTSGSPDGSTPDAALLSFLTLRQGKLLLTKFHNVMNTGPGCLNHVL